MGSNIRIKSNKNNAQLEEQTVWGAIEKSPKLQYCKH